jgi:hypothetical protein
MARIEIPLTGPSYRHRSPPVSAQTCRNWVPEVVSESPYRTVLAQPHGTRHFAQTVFGELAYDEDNDGVVTAWHALPAGKDRGMHIFRNRLYKVSGNSLYRIDPNGKVYRIGAINGSKRCVFASSADEMVIVTGGMVYKYTGRTLTLSFSPAFEQPQAVAYLNNQAIYDGNGSRFVVSNPGELTFVNGLNYAAAESSGDDLVRPYVYQQTLYLMGDSTIESWYNSGTGNPPFARLDGGIIQVGLGALHSVDHNDRGVFFLGADRNVYMLNGANAQPISTIPLAQEFASYSKVDNAIGFCFTLDAQNFYQLTFPTVNRTWCYCMQSGAWFERASGYDAHIATSYAFCYGRHLIGHDQYVLEMRPEFAEDGVPIPLNNENVASPPVYPPPRTMIRERVTAPINGQLLGAPGRDLHMGRLELAFEAGTGLAAGQGRDPIIMMSFSDDAGRTWSNEMQGQIGRMGDFLASASWHGLGSFQSRIVRFRVSDPVRCTLMAASADVEVGI